LLARPRGYVRVGPLEQIADIKREAGRLYKAARQKAGNDIDPATAYRLAQVLNIVKGCNISRTWLSLGICIIPNSVSQFERPWPCPSAKCR
jgi:hypothetical protein